MAGNEISIAKYFLKNIGKIKLKHLGLIKKIGAPDSGDGYTVVTTIKQLALISTESSGKKADIYINGVGVSLKQSGGSFPFNRLQRAESIKKLMTFTMGKLLIEVDHGKVFLGNQILKG